MGISSWLHTWEKQGFPFSFSFLCHQLLYPFSKGRVYLLGAGDVGGALEAEDPTWWLQSTRPPLSLNRGSAARHPLLSGKAAGASGVGPQGGEPAPRFCGTGCGAGGGPKIPFWSCLLPATWGGKWVGGAHRPGCGGVWSRGHPPPPPSPWGLGSGDKLTSLPVICAQSPKISEARAWWLQCYVRERLWVWVA